MSGDRRVVQRFPFRLAAAIFWFLNFFSMMYSGRQLKTVKAADADFRKMIESAAK